VTVSITRCSDGEVVSLGTNQAPLGEASLAAHSSDASAGDGGTGQKPTLDAGAADTGTQSAARLESVMCADAEKGSGPEEYSFTTGSGTLAIPTLKLLQLTHSVPERLPILTGTGAQGARKEEGPHFLHREIAIRAQHPGLNRKR
jgi:hypothetical protein